MKIYRRCAYGAEAGLLAGAGVALLFLLQDVVTLAPFSTPEALANNLFGTGAVQENMGLLATAAGVAAMGTRLLAYTVTHFVTFALLGVAAAFVLRTGSWASSLAGGALYGLTVFTGVLYAGRLLMDAPVVVESVGIPAVLVANATAGVILGGGLFLVRPEGKNGQVESGGPAEG